MIINPAKQKDREAMAFLKIKSRKAFKKLEKKMRKPSALKT
jgi:hypothetical protein